MMVRRARDKGKEQGKKHGKKHGKKQGTKQGETGRNRAKSKVVAWRYLREKKENKKRLEQEQTKTTPSTGMITMHHPSGESMEN